MTDGGVKLLQFLQTLYLLLRASIGRLEFMHYPQEANGAAHELTRVCFSLKNSCIWIVEPLAFFCTAF
jgi:hypothetical protein